MGLADLHIHTTYSWDGTCTVSAVLKQAADQTDLDVIAITDHDEIQGALDAIELAPAYGLNVIPGSEVSTAEGHLLTLFIHKRIPAGLSLIETVKKAGEQGGICIAAHPMAPGTSSLKPDAIRKALADPEIARILVGIEAFNAGLFYGNSNQAAYDFARTLPVALVGNSDAHYAGGIGQGASRFNGRTALDLRRALETRSTEIVRVRQSTPSMFFRELAPRIILRKLGWVFWNPGPEYPLKIARARRVMLPNPAK
ncbi:MAG: PHP domain-containing protein [Omnitrophica WOR_2 bacterium]